MGFKNGLIYSVIVASGIGGGYFGHHIKRAECEGRYRALYEIIHQSEDGSFDERDFRRRFESWDREVNRIDLTGEFSGGLACFVLSGFLLRSFLDSKDDL